MKAIYLLLFRRYDQKCRFSVQSTESFSQAVIQMTSVGRDEYPLGSLHLIRCFVLLKLNKQRSKFIVPYSNNTSEPESLLRVHFKFGVAWNIFLGGKMIVYNYEQISAVVQYLSPSGFSLSSYSKPLHLLISSQNQFKAKILRFFFLALPPICLTIFKVSITAVSFLPCARIRNHQLCHQRISIHMEKLCNAHKVQSIDITSYALLYYQNN